nr:protein mono-ADP-ribosyltransferase PARP14 isoform X2 [Crassostrea gigas]
MEELECKKDQDKHVPKFLHSTVPSLCSHQNKVTVSNSNLYPGKINEAQVCVGKSCLSEPESPACRTEEIRDNSKKVELQEENDQDIYVPKFFIPPINIFSIGHAVENAEIKSVNEAQVCVDDSFLPKSETPDSDSKGMGSMEIERSIASDKKPDPDILDALDAKNAAAKEKFTINDRGIQAQMYFHCPGLPEQPMNWEDMACVSYKGNEYIVKFVKNIPKECSQIEEALQKKFVKVEWPKSKSDFTIKLQCTVTKDMENAKEILKNWKKEAEAEMDRQMKKYLCQKHSTVPETWPALLAQLKTLTIGQPERVAVLLDKKKHTVIVAGYEENFEALTRIILNIIRTEESKIQNQTEKIMKNTPLDFNKCQQLWNTHFWKKLTNDFPDLDFQVEIEKEEVNLTGKPIEVNAALIKMHEYLMNTKSKSLNISKGRYEIFMKKEVKEGFIAEMKAKGNKAVWNVTEDKVEMTSTNSKMADEALEIFKEFIPEKRIQMKDLVKVLTMHDWQACVKELRDKHNEKLIISSSSSEVCVTASKDIFENVFKQIEHVMKICSEKCRIDHRVVKLSPQQFRYIERFGEHKIGEIPNACNSKEFEIKQNQSDCSIEITGNDEDVKKAYENLMRFIKNLREDSCSINKPGSKVFFNSSKGRVAMKKAGKDTSCIILDKEGIRHIKENRESGSFRGHIRTSYSLPIKIAECELQFCDKKLIVMRGDVTKLKVDVLVNAENGMLGLALAISKAGGKSIQEESRTYFVSKGTVPDGEAIPAQPGELPYKRLIHAVGPRWRDGSHNDEQLLKKAIFECLELTDGYKHSSIAIPTLSARIFGYPVAESVRVILDAIESYIKTVPSSSIKEVYFCDVDDTIVKEFVICLKRKFGLEVKEFSVDEHVQKSPVENTGSDSEEEKPRRSRSRSEKPICEIKVISGELAKMRVDVIVSSTDKSLNLTLAATSKSLLRAGGESLQDECIMKYKHGIQPGEVAMTKGGNLYCKQVYHGTIKKWDHNRGDALIRFTEFVDNCLRMADKNWMSTIAFPAIGTGRLGYPPDLAAKTMLKCCRDFLRHNSSTLLKEIIFVVYHEDKDTLQTFQSVMSSEDVSRGTETSRSSYPQRRSTDFGRRDKSFKLNKLNVEIHQGDITQERSDVVVNKVTESLDSSKGAASKAILKAAVNNIQTECRGGGSTSVGLPSNWAHMTSDQTMVEVKLSPSDNEYKDVVARFTATSGGPVSISEIRRVQNPSLYQQYAAKRKEISTRNRKNPEQWLWHGTYPDTVKKIINNGFNRSYCGKHGTSCGAGVYFAVHASYSLGYCSADSNGCKHMFSVQVATGDVCQGNSSLLVLPPKLGAGGHVTYDSASDNPSNPVIFVIFHDSQAYPAYHIILR